MRFFFFILLVVCCVPSNWAQTDDDVFETYEIEPPYTLEEEENYAPKSAVFDLEAVQNEPLPERQFAVDTWEKVRRENDYTLEAQPQERVVPEAREPRSWEWDSGGELLKIAMWILVIVVMALVLFLLLRPRPKNRSLVQTPDSATIDLENIEEQLEEADVLSFITQAEAAENYQLAIRLHFLAVLQALAKTGAIRWKIDKTNRTYLRELRANVHYAEFKRLSAIFEQVWYGEQIPQGGNYPLMRDAFLALRQKITLSPGHVE